MNTKVTYSLLGSLIGAILNVLINLISNFVQQRAIGETFTNINVIWLLIFIFIGLVLGLWASNKSSQDEDSSGSNHRAIKLNKIKSKKGSIIANDQTGKGVEINNASAFSNIEVTASVTAESNPPKSPPPT